MKWFKPKRKPQPRINFSEAESPRESAVTKGVRSYLDLIFPSGIDGTLPDTVLIDGAYTACLICLDFPYTVKGAWLDDLINAGEGVEISLFHYPQNKTQMIRDITTQIGFTKHRIVTGGDNQTDGEIQQNAYAHAMHIKKSLAAGDDLWFMHLLIRISAFEKEDLNWRIKTVESILAGKDIFYQRTDFRQLEAFVSSLPFCELNTTFKEQSERNILTSSLCATYPFISYELSDPEGVFMGLNEHNGSAVMLDIFNTKKYSNANMVVLGTSGSGKTFTTQMLAYRMRLQKIPIMMICPLKGFEYRRLCENVNGNYIRIAPGSKHTINIMDIRPSSGEGNKDESLLAAKLQKLQIFFSLMFPEITHKERQMLDEKFLRVYAKRGITPDNSSIYMPKTDSGRISFKPVLKEMPTLGDLYEEICEDAQLADIAIKLKPYVSGSLEFFNGQTNVNLNNDYVVADISDMQGDAIPLAMFMVLDSFWDRIKQDITQKKCLILDEAWRLIGAGGNKLTAEFVLQVFKIIRGYGGSAIAATQDISDFLSLDDGKYGRGIINNAKLKMVLQIEDFEAAALKDVLGLSEEELTRITHFQRGHGLLYAGNNHVAIDFKASETEKRLITTDRSEILKYRKEESL
jgi:type IV secretory pathway VirB4 component